MVALLFILFIIAIFFWQIQRYKDGGTSKIKAVGLYSRYTFTPVFLYAALFFALVGIEELMDTAIIGEEYARSLLFVVVGGSVVVIITTLAFIIYSEGKRSKRIRNGPYRTRCMGH